ncbi:hypothetical protein J2Z53_001022 [Clostridium moniliforme]|uniref:Uncharacterized protein n=1 Tax=Clostridium moniliforme TaxID=39489 RepID=A0ABS4EZM6_9CLOT|nr:hypothetical protein [Clostridium moniliforme]
MNMKKTGKLAVFIIATTSLIATLVNDKKRKEESLNNDKI